MKISDVLTNEFLVKYDEENHELRIFRLKNGQKEYLSPIVHKLSMLKNMGKDEASRWVGESFLIFIPETRKELFDEIE